MPRNVDLDEIHKAREEAYGEPPTVVLGGRTFVLPVALPAAAITGLARVRSGDLDGFADALEGLFGPDAGDVVTAGLALEDFDAIVEGVYGEEPGKASD